MLCFCKSAHSARFTRVFAVRHVSPFLLRVRALICLCIVSVALRLFEMAQILVSLSKNVQEIDVGERMSRFASGSSQSFCVASEKHLRTLVLLLEGTCTIFFVWFLFLIIPHRFVT